jgi:hypothetical protein
VLLKSVRGLKLLASLLLVAVVVTFAPFDLLTNETEAATSYTNRYSVVPTFLVLADQNTSTAQALHAMFIGCMGITSLVRQPAKREQVRQ